MNLNRHVPLRRRPLAARRYADPVSHQTWTEVVERDLRIAGGCVAPHLDAMAGLCRDRWGNPVLPYAREALTVDHIREEPGGQRRSVRRWLVTSCWGHHVNGGWTTSHRPEIRRYLEEVEP